MSACVLSSIAAEPMCSFSVTDLLAYVAGGAFSRESNLLTPLPLPIEDSFTRRDDFGFVDLEGPSIFMNRLFPEVVAVLPPIPGGSVSPEEVCFSERESSRLKGFPDFVLLRRNIFV